MTLNELYKALDARFPKSLSCEWDHDGIMVLPDGEKEVKKVLCCLDCTYEAIKIAAEGNFDLILCHHPLIFYPLESINTNTPSGAKIAFLLRAGIAVFSFHTRLDCAEGGVNDTLCALLGLRNVTEFYTEGLPMGRVGELPEPTFAEPFAAFVKEKLGAPSLAVTNTTSFVRRVALLGGSGGDLWREAKNLGADVFLTGEAKYHDLLDAKEEGFCLMTAGHDYTEKPVAGTLARVVRELCPEVATLSLDSDNFTFVS